MSKRVRFRFGGPMAKPRYNHDCDVCIFCGTREEFDIYWCPRSEHCGGSLILRKGDEASNYYSTIVSMALRHDPSVTIRENNIVHEVARQLLLNDHVRVLIGDIPDEEDW